MYAMDVITYIICVGVCSYTRNVMVIDETSPTVSETSIRVSHELADELHDRKNRGDSYEDVIWRLIEAQEEPGND